MVSPSGILCPLDFLATDRTAAQAQGQPDANLRRVRGESSAESADRTGQGLALRLKRVSGIEVEHCAQCGGSMKMIASIKQPAVMHKILQHLQERDKYLTAPKAQGPSRGAMEGIE